MKRAIFCSGIHSNNPNVSSAIRRGSGNAIVLGDTYVP